MVVPVLIMSCHVSLKPNTGPESAHSTSAASAIMNADGRPVALAIHFANRVKKRGFVWLHSRSLDSKRISSLRGEVGAWIGEVYRRSLDCSKVLYDQVSSAILFDPYEA